MQKSKYNYIDLFAGCGGLSEGFEKTGKFSLLASCEWDKKICETMQNRHIKKWKDSKDSIVCFDIQRTQELFNGWKNDAVYGSNKGFDSFIGNKKVDVIVGGPPCQAYSIAGRIRDEHGMKNDYRNYLFESYIKVVERYEPDFIIFENVPGMLSARPKGEKEPIINKIKNKFESVGYAICDDLRQAVIDVSDFGVPQHRKRVIVFGVNKKKIKNYKNLLDKFYKEIIPSFKKKKRKTVSEAIFDLPKIFPSKDSKQGYIFEKDISEVVLNHEPRFHNKRDIEIFGLLAKDIHIGSNVYTSSEELKRLYTEKTGKTSSVHKYHVLRSDKPSNTIVAHLYKDGLRHIHPDYKQARSITVREAARLQTFDDDFEFLGSKSDQYKMIGNAVPPVFSEVLAKSLLKIMEEAYDS